jgi:hypothetical protein
MAFSKPGKVGRSRRAHRLLAGPKADAIPRKRAEATQNAFIASDDKLLNSLPTMKPCWSATGWLDNHSGDTAAMLFHQYGLSTMICFLWR